MTDQKLGALSKAQLAAADELLQYRCDVGLVEVGLLIQDLEGIKLSPETLTALRRKIFWHTVLAAAAVLDVQQHVK